MKQGCRAGFVRDGNGITRNICYSDLNYPLNRLMKTPVFGTIFFGKLHFVCSGSMRLVHIHCLSRWIESRPHSIPLQYCELCSRHFSPMTIDMLRSISDDVEDIPNCPVTMKKALNETMSNIDTIQRRIRLMQHNWIIILLFLLSSSNFFCTDLRDIYFPIYDLFHE